MRVSVAWERDSSLLDSAATLSGRKPTRTTCWCRDDKAQEHLGYRGRDLDTGLRDALAALG